MGSWGQWTNLWSLTPGAAGKAAGQTAFSGATPFSPAPYPKVGAFSNAFLDIELQNNAQWTFGPVTWQEIVLVANTTDTSWCDEYQLAGQDTVFTSTAPVATAEGGNRVVCTIQRAELTPP